jgi:hypothetical protein
MERRKWFPILCLVSALIFEHPLRAGEQPPLQKIRAAATPISGSMSPPWAATEAVRSVVEEFAERSPNAKDQDPAKMFEDRFVRQLQSSGFTDSLYR